MEQMSIRDTQFIIARHTDRQHSHCHIVFNRVDNNGKTISDKNDRYRNEKTCKQLTEKYGLYMARKGACKHRTTTTARQSQVRHLRSIETGTAKGHFMGAAS